MLSSIALWAPPNAPPRCNEVSIATRVREGISRASGTLATVATAADLRGVSAEEGVPEVDQGEGKVLEEEVTQELAHSDVGPPAVHQEEALQYETGTRSQSFWLLSPERPRQEMRPGTPDHLTERHNASEQHFVKVQRVAPPVPEHRPYELVQTIVWFLALNQSCERETSIHEVQIIHQVFNGSNSQDYDQWDKCEVMTNSSSVSSSLYGMTSSSGLMEAWESTHSRFILVAQYALGSTDYITGTKINKCNTANDLTVNPEKSVGETETESPAGGEERRAESSRAELSHLGGFPGDTLILLMISGGYPALLLPLPRLPNLPDRSDVSRASNNNKWPVENNVWHLVKLTLRKWTANVLVITSSG
ncbi:hypothetical protein INR49_002418 [Caranx melampygus]|nr:hypothetical protein INR49_002418 [Caranx melampygus]